MSGQNKQMASSRIQPQERQRQADLHQSQRAHTQPDAVQTHGTRALIWYDTPTGRTCKAMHIPVFGSIDKSASVINTRSPAPRSVMPRSAVQRLIFVGGGVEEQQKDERTRFSLDFFFLLFLDCWSRFAYTVNSLHATASDVQCVRKRQHNVVLHACFFCAVVIHLCLRNAA